MSQKARDLMEKDVGVVDASASLTELEQRFAEARVSGFPVLKDGRVVGVVSRSDVVERLADAKRFGRRRSGFYEGSGHFEAEEILETFSEVARRSQMAAESLRVEDVMTTDVVAVAADASLEAVARSLIDHQIHRVLVLDGEKLLGLISSQDFVRLFAEGKVGRLQRALS
jgi:CBS domain-containing protein